MFKYNHCSKVRRFPWKFYWFDISKIKVVHCMHIGWQRTFKEKFQFTMVISKAHQCLCWNVSGETTDNMTASTHVSKITQDSGINSNAVMHRWNHMDISLKKWIWLSFMHVTHLVNYIIYNLSIFHRICFFWVWVVSWDSWMYPYQRTPMPYIVGIYWVLIPKNP